MRGSRTVIKHADFTKGFNTLPGIFSDGDEGFSESVNLMVDPDLKVRLRPPLLAEATTLSTNSQGLWRINGRWYTVAKRGDTVTHTGAWATNVTTLFFDPPPETVSWTLKAWGILDDTLCVYIDHERNSTASPRLLALHVFDGLAGYPTYVFDPAAPQYYGPELPQQFAGPATVPTYGAFTPTVCNGHGKLWAARADGNVQFCGIGRPRVWGGRSATDIETNGTVYYHAAPSTGAVFLFYVPEVYADLTDVAKVTTYKAQKFDTTTGTWTDLAAVGGVPTAAQFRITASSTAWNSNCTKVEIGPQADGTIVRFVVVIKIDVASAWYIARHQVNLDYWASEDEADFLYTSGQESNGENITALSIVRNRLFVGYPSSSSLWQVGALASDSAFLDSYQYGTTGQPTLVGSVLIVSTAQGPRGISLEGQNFQGLADRNIGKGLPTSAAIRLSAGAFWAWNGLTIAPATANWSTYAAEAHLPAGSVLRSYGGQVSRLMAFQWSEERGITAWSWWDVAVTPSSDFIAVDSKLYFRSGQSVRYFDGAASVSVGDSGVAYDGYGSWHFRKFPARARLVNVALDGYGIWTIKVATAAWADIPPIDASVRLEGITLDRNRAALTGTGQAYSLVVQGSSADAPAINSLELAILPLGR